MIASLLSLGLASSLTPLADVYVDANSLSCTSGDGSVAAPVCSINAAIGLAAAGDTIRIAPGTYVENVAITFDLDLVGTAGADVTIVDGGQAGSVITIPEAVTVLIEGLTVTGGRAGHGGGILTDGTLTLRNSTVRGNTATGTPGLAFQRGAGIATTGTVDPVNITIESSLIEDNHLVGTGSPDGGGIFHRGGDLVISNSTIRGNTVMGVGGSKGAGIYAAGSNITIRNSTFADNVAQFYGGGIYAAVSTLDITQSTFSGNSAQFGGGISVDTCQLRITNSTLSGNSAEIAGGAIRARYLLSQANLWNSTVMENSASFTGSAIDVISGAYYDPLTVRNSIIAGNTRLLTDHLKSLVIFSGWVGISSARKSLEPRLGSSTA